MKEHTLGEFLTELKHFLSLQPRKRQRESGELFSSRKFSHFVFIVVLVGTILDISITLYVFYRYPLIFAANEFNWVVKSILEHFGAAPFVAYRGGFGLLFIYLSYKDESLAKIVAISQLPLTFLPLAWLGALP